MGSFGFEEMFLVAIVAIVVFGRDLPTMARKAGRWYRDIRRKMEDLKTEVQRQIPEVDINVDLDADDRPAPAPARDLSKPFNPVVPGASEPPPAAPSGGAGNPP